MLDKLKNKDGSYNATLIAGLLSLLIIFVQQVLAVFGITFTGNWDNIVSAINTGLAILGALGVVKGAGTVTLANHKEIKKGDTNEY